MVAPLWVLMVFLKVLGDNNVKRMGVYVGYRSKSVDRMSKGFRVLSSW